MAGVAQHIRPVAGSREARLTRIELHYARAQPLPGIIQHQMQIGGGNRPSRLWRKVLRAALCASCPLDINALAVRCPKLITQSDSVEWDETLSTQPLAKPSDAELYQTMLNGIRERGCWY